MKAVLANLGFVLQTAGLIALLPIPVALITKDEPACVFAFLITSVVFLASGFLLNALAQRKDLDFRSSCSMVTLSFFLMGLIGSIPYFSMNTFADASLGSRIVNSFFESVSGYTTTGLTLVTDVQALPEALVFYRGLTQWIGGVSIVFLFLGFFYSERTLDNLSRAVGIRSVTFSLKRSFLVVLLIYAAYTAIFIGILYWLGLRDLLTNIPLVFSTISTGGFTPFNDSALIASFPVNIVLVVLMILGGTSFAIHHAWFTGRWRNALSVEFLAFIALICVVAAGLSSIARISISAAFFEAASAASTTGFTNIDLGNIPTGAEMLFITLMFVGGSAFSTAGGVKIIRALVFLKSVPWSVKGTITGRLGKFNFGRNELNHADVIACWLVILLTALFTFAFALVFTLYGFRLVDSLFELTSAISTTGLSVGITSLSLPTPLKLMLAFLMLLGRIEIVPLLVMLTPRGREQTERTEPPAPGPTGAKPHGELLGV